MKNAVTGSRPTWLGIARWQWAWLLLAAISLPPVAYHAFQGLKDNARIARVQLIQRYNLWETDPHYRGTPQAWTRFAAMLLNTDQLMQRVREKHGALAEQIEQDFEHDNALSHSKIIAFYLTAWGVPLALLYGAGWLRQRRRQQHESTGARRTQPRVRPHDPRA